MNHSTIGTPVEKSSQELLVDRKRVFLDGSSHFHCSPPHLFSASLKQFQVAVWSRSGSTHMPMISSMYRLY